MRAYMWNLQTEWLLRSAISEDDENLASDLAGPGFHLKANTNQLVIESNDHMTKRGQASPDDGDASVLTFAAPVLPPANEDVDEEEEECGSYRSFGRSGRCDDRFSHARQTRAIPAGGHARGRGAARSWK
jgi:hypothetical protein